MALPVGLLAMLGSVALEPTMDFATFNLRVSTAFTLQMLANLLMCLGYVAWVMRALASARTGQVYLGAPRTLDVTLHVAF